jgi:hypothetical protein
MLVGRGPPITPSTVIGCSGSCGASCWGSVAAVAAVLVVDGAAVVVVVAGSLAVATTLVPAECLACRRYELSVCRAVHTASAARTASAAAAASTVAVHLQQHLGNHAVLGVRRRRSPLLAQVPPAMLPVFSSPLQLKCLQPGCSRLNQKRRNGVGRPIQDADGCGTSCWHVSFMVWAVCRSQVHRLCASHVPATAKPPVPRAACSCVHAVVATLCATKHQCQYHSMMLLAAAWAQEQLLQAQVHLWLGGAAVGSGSHTVQLANSAPAHHSRLCPHRLPATSLSMLACVAWVFAPHCLEAASATPARATRTTPKAGAFCAPRCCRCWWRV